MMTRAVPETADVVRYLHSRLPEPIANVLLSDRDVRRMLAAEMEDAVSVAGHRVSRALLFDAVRAVLSGDQPRLKTTAGRRIAAQGEVLHDEAVVFHLKRGAVHFAGGTLLSRDVSQRLRAFKAVTLKRTLSKEADLSWEARLAEPEELSDDEVVELLGALDATAEGFKDETVSLLGAKQATLASLLPDDPRYFASLFEPKLLGAGLADVASAIEGRVSASRDTLYSRLLHAAPFAAVPQLRFGQLSAPLPDEDAHRLVNEMLIADDLFSAIAALEICCVRSQEPLFGDRVGVILKGLIGDADDLARRAKDFWIAFAITCSLTNSRGMFRGLQTLHRRVVEFGHAGHLLRALHQGSVEMSALGKMLGAPTQRQISLRARIELRDDPYWSLDQFSHAAIAAYALVRAHDVVGTAPSDHVRSEWAAITSAAFERLDASGMAILLLCPGPFDHFTDDWRPMRTLTMEDLEALEDVADRDVASTINLLATVAAVYAVPEPLRSRLVEFLLNFAERCEGQELTILVDVGVRLAVKWQDAEFARSLFATGTSIDPAARVGRAHQAVGLAAAGPQDAWGARLGAAFLHLALSTSNASEASDLLATIEALSQLDSRAGVATARARSAAILRI